MNKISVLGCVLVREIDFYENI